MPGRHFYIQFSGGDGSLFMSSLSPSSSLFFPVQLKPAESPIKSTMLHALPSHVDNHFLLVMVTRWSPSPTKLAGCAFTQIIYCVSFFLHLALTLYLFFFYKQLSWLANRGWWREFIWAFSTNISCHSAFFFFFSSSPAAFSAIRAIFVKVLQWRGQFNILELFWGDKAPYINDNLCFFNQWLFLACNNIPSVFITTSNKVFQWLCSYERQPESLRHANLATTSGFKEGAVIQIHLTITCLWMCFSQQLVTMVGETVMHWRSTQRAETEKARVLGIQLHDKNKHTYLRTGEVVCVFEWLAMRVYSEL